MWNHIERSLESQGGSNAPYKEVPRPPCYTTFQDRDMLWMMGLALGKARMWVGCNSKITKDSLPIQRVEYMENITLPSTRLGVIAEKLCISQQVAREFKIVTHYPEIEFCRQISQNVLSDCIKF